MCKHFVSLVTAALVLSGTAFAGPRASAPIDARQHRQATRIRDGVASGQLTRAETARLCAEQRAIAREERWLRRAGLTPGEYRHLQRELNQSSRHIARERHDRQRR
jgi:hypothetical protein